MPDDIGWPDEVVEPVVEESECPCRPELLAINMTLLQGVTARLALIADDINYAGGVVYDGLASVGAEVHLVGMQAAAVAGHLAGNLPDIAYSLSSMDAVLQAEVPRLPLRLEDIDKTLKALTEKIGDLPMDWGDQFGEKLLGWVTGDSLADWVKWVRNYFIVGGEATDRCIDWALHGRGGAQMKDKQAEIIHAEQADPVRSAKYVIDRGKEEQEGLLKELGWDKYVDDALKMTLPGVVKKDMYPCDIAMMNVTKGLGMAWAAGAAAHAVAVGADLCTTSFLPVNLKPLAAMVGQLAGFGRWAGSLMVNLCRFSVDQPLSQYFAEMYRSSHPGFGTVADASLKGDINDAEYTKWMKALGFTDHVIQWLIKGKKREPRHSELKIMAESLSVTDEYLKLKLRRAGYDKTDQTQMMRGLRRSQERGYKDQGTMQAMRLRQMGHWDRGELIEFLGTEKYTPTIRAQLIEAGDLRAEFTARAALQRAVKAGFDGDFITDEDAQDYLLFALPDAEIRDWTWKEWQCKRYKRITRLRKDEEEEIERKHWRSVLGKYQRAHKDSLVTTVELHEVIEACGFQPHFEGVVKDQAQYNRERTVEAKFRKYHLPVVREKFLSGEIDAGLYVKWLAGIYEDPSMATSELALMQKRKAERETGRVRREDMPVYRRAYAAGLVGIAELERVLRDADFSDANIELQLAMAESERRGRDEGRTRSDDLGIYQRAHRAGLITTAELREVAESVGLSGPATKLLIALAESERRTSATGLVVRADLALYRRAALADLVPVSRYAAVLRAAGVPADESALQVQLLEAEIARAIGRGTPRDRLPIYRNAYSKDLVTVDELLEAYLDAGYDAETANIALQAAVASRVARRGEVVGMSDVRAAEAALRLLLLSEDEYREVALAAGVAYDDVERQVRDATRMRGVKPPPGPK